MGFNIYAEKNTENFDSAYLFSDKQNNNLAIQTHNIHTQK